MKIRCLIVDDEPLARKGTEENLMDFDSLELVGTAENVQEAGKFLQAQEVDLMFLDINMPRVSGIEFLKTLKKRPIVIIISAYPDYALEGFELDVLDYLLKPVPYDRFVKAIQKAEDYFELKSKSLPNQTDFFFIKTESKFEKILFAEILFIEAADNYVLIHTIFKKHIAYITIKIVEESLPSDDFIKVHKSYIVSIPKIKSIEASEIIIDKYRIPISRSLKDEVMEKIVNRNLLKR